MISKMNQIIKDLNLLIAFKKLNNNLYKISDSFETNSLKLSSNENQLIKSESIILKYCKISFEIKTQT